MATAKKNQSGSWSINVYIGKNPDGKNVCKHLTARTKKEVEAKAAELLTHKKKTVKYMTVSECFERYIDTRRSLCKPRTIRDYILNVKAFPELLQMQIADLSDELCQSAIDRYMKTHAPKTTVDRWHYLQSAVQYSDRSFRPDVRLPSIKRKRLDFPDTDRFQELLLYIRDHNMEVPVLLGMTCGLRRSEISALDLSSDIDYARGRVYITKSMALDEHNHYVISSPKTEAGTRTVTCPRWVLDRIAQSTRRPDFRLLLPNSITTGWRRLSRRFNLDCSFHGLRHYYASVMEAAGVPEIYQMERMGHTTNYMLKRYQEYLRSKEVEIDESLMSRLDSLNPFNTDSTNPPAVSFDTVNK